VKTSCPRYGGTHAEINLRAFALEKSSTEALIHAKRPSFQATTFNVHTYTCDAWQISWSRSESEFVSARDTHARVIKVACGCCKNREIQRGKSEIYSLPDISRLSGLSFTNRQVPRVTY